MFRFLILGLLRNSGALHGFALMKEYRDRSGTQLNTGSFYRELPRLKAEGLIKETANPDDADPRRVPYEITDAGRTAFDAWFSDPGDPFSGGFEEALSARALFFTEARPEAIRKVIDHWKDELWMRAKRIERAREVALEEVRKSNGARFAVLPILLARRQKRLATDLEFIEELRSVYEEWNAQHGSAKQALPASRQSPRRIS